MESRKLGKIEIVIGILFIGFFLFIQFMMSNISNEITLPIPILFGIFAILNGLLRLDYLKKRLVGITHIILGIIALVFIIIALIILFASNLVILTAIVRIGIPFSFAILVMSEGYQNIKKNIPRNIISNIQKVIGIIIFILFYIGLMNVYVFKMMPMFNLFWINIIWCTMSILLMVYAFVLGSNKLKNDHL